MTSSGPAGAAWWSSFPADAEPRPLNLFGPRIRMQGFVSGEAKEAWLDGAVLVAAEVPDAVARAVTRRPHDAPDGRVHRVVLDRATRIEHPFPTDRGDVVLPAWRLNGPDLLDDGCVVLDPAVRPWWASDDHPEAAGVAGNRAVVDRSGLQVRWPAAGGMFAAHLGVEFEEHRSYVVGRPRSEERPPAGTTHVGAVLLHQLVDGMLRQPLGGRVLVTEHGFPLAAVPAIPPM